MVKFKLSTTILIVILAIIYSFYYVYSVSVKKDLNNLVEYKITQNALFIKELIDKDKTNNESQVKEWVLSSKIAEDIDDLNDYYQDKKNLEEKIRAQNIEPLPKEKTGVRAQNIEPIQKEEVKTKEMLEEELNIVNKDISSLILSLEKRFYTLTKTFNMNFYYLISEHLSKIKEMTSNFETTEEFINSIQKGKTDSDIWIRKNFLYSVYGVPIELNGKVLGSLFVGIKKTKRDADFITERIKSKIAFVNNNRVLSTNIDNFLLKNKLNKYIENHKEDLKTLSYNDISEVFSVNINTSKYLSIFIPLKSYSNKVSGIFVISSVSDNMITSVTKIKYWLPIFAIAIFLFVLISIFIINKNFLQPYIELEIETNKFLDNQDEEINIDPFNFGEAEGLARSIKALIKKIKGESNTASTTWDDPLFITELKKDDFSNKKKEVDHYDAVYDMFIRAHKNNGLPYEHIKRDEFKKRLTNIENRLKKKFKVKDIYFEVLVDETGVIKLHPQILK